MQKQRHCEKNLEFKKHHIPCATSNKTSVSKTDRICGFLFGPPEAGMGGGAKPSFSTFHFLFAISSGVFAVEQF